MCKINLKKKKGKQSQVWWQAHLQKLIKVSVACIPTIPALGAICSSRLFLSLGYETLEKGKSETWREGRKRRGTTACSGASHTTSLNLSLPAYETDG